MLIANGSLLQFMEMRHHAGHSVAVLVIDEQIKRGPRHAMQERVIRTAAVLGCPTWFAELGGGASNTRESLVKAAGLTSNADADQLDMVLKKGQKMNVFEGTDLAERMDEKGTEFLVILGTHSQCCVQHTILGSIRSSQSGTQPPRKPLPPEPGSIPAVTRKSLPKPPSPSAVSRCFVLTNPSIINGELPAPVTGHPKCFVFAELGGELWEKSVTERVIKTARGQH